MTAVLGACTSSPDEPSVAQPTTSTTGAPTTTAAEQPATTSTGRPGGTKPGRAPTTTAAPRTLDCGTVAFTPQSEDAASQIKATGLSCAEAQSVVRVVGEQTSAGGPAALDAQGYHCVRTGGQEDPLPQAFYECTKGSQKITFVRS
ncbi:MAG: hypothetical protein M3179_02550 [Actinomycetota bacterium]|nr:hypothetical protein [Actinomycetota bacterium]